MIIVLILISILLFILLMFIDDDIACIPVFGFLIKTGIMIWLIIEVINIGLIDDKVELYTKQNKEIEKKVEIAVKQYMEHENKTFTALKTNESYITLVTMYPELKSDNLIKKEVELYEKNNEKIVSLKEKKINGKIYKWFLYFG